LKIMTVLGTRPEIIRLSCVIEKLDALCEHVLVHTGQNYAPGLSDVFFEQLGVRAPDRYLGIREPSFGAQIGGIIASVEGQLVEERPDRMLVLGDTNSGLAAVVAKRLGIPVFHMEAGNRCFDDRVPEEVNRRIIDHSSDVLMPYTERSRANLLREGFPGERVYVTGNPIYEVLCRHEVAIASSTVLARLELEPGGYLLVTLHREENVDVEARLESFLEGLARVRDEHGRTVVFSVHPRTRARLEQAGIGEEAGVLFAEPFGFFDFVALERSAYCVLSDSGTVQEECCIMGVPAVTLRDSTERPETIECGSNVLSGVGRGGVGTALELALQPGRSWQPPPEYLADDVSSTVAGIVLGRLPSE
jgi:UDP-N-acetylglucosamine 2-epimerase (non-hydrolysing)